MFLYLDPVPKLSLLLTRSCLTGMLKMMCHLRKSELQTGNLWIVQRNSLLLTWNLWNPELNGKGEFCIILTKVSNFIQSCQIMWFQPKHSKKFERCVKTSLNDSPTQAGPWNRSKMIWNWTIVVNLTFRLNLFVLAYCVAKVCLFKGQK